MNDARTLRGTRVTLEQRDDGIRLILPPSGWSTSGGALMLAGVIAALVPVWLLQDVWRWVLPLPGLAILAWGLRRSRRFLVLQVAGGRLILLDGGRATEWAAGTVERLFCRETASTYAHAGGRMPYVHLWLKLKDGGDVRLVRGYDPLSLEHAATLLNKALGR